MRDFQRELVYEWERKIIAPRDTGLLAFENIAPVVNYVWSSEGLDYPPKVKPIDKRNKTAQATGSRLNLHFQETGNYTWIVLHELAHALTCDIDNNSNWHREDFVGVYMKLVDKYLHINSLLLMASAKDMGVKFNTNAEYTCLR